MRRIFIRGVWATAAISAASCQDPKDGEAVPQSAQSPFVVTQVADLDEPWAIRFLPDRSLLVSEKAGLLKRLDEGGKIHVISGLPEVFHEGQAGLGDLALHPRFASNALLYFSYAELGEGGTVGAAVARGRLALSDDGTGSLEGVEVVWRQRPKVAGSRHLSQRIAFGPDGDLYISSGDRDRQTPAQDLDTNLGKVVRIRDDGSELPGNPFAALGDMAAQVWTRGHRNPLGIAFDARGDLWAVEMGPAGGDELNRLQAGGNYGWPLVSEGNHYDGRTIPKHASAPMFLAPVVSWNPVISPSSLHVYTGNEFRDWQGDLLIGGLSSESLVRVRLSDGAGWEVARYDMGARIRAVAEGPDGAVWLLEDERPDRGPGAGRLLRLTARR